MLISIQNLIGSKAADTLVGDGAGNVIIGGIGADKLTGGGSADAFRVNTLAEGKDTITDFASGVDKLLYLKSGFGLNAADANDFTSHYFIGATAHHSRPKPAIVDSCSTRPTAQLLWDMTARARMLQHSCSRKPM